MERELWKKVYRLVMETAKDKTIKRATFTNAQIILTYLWAVIHDRPVYWACKEKNWPICYRRRPLPTPSTMTRRLRRCDIQQLLKDIETSLSARPSPETELLSNDGDTQDPIGR